VIKRIKEKNTLNSALNGALTSSLRSSLARSSLILPVLDNLLFQVAAFQSGKSKEQLVTVDGSNKVSAWLDLSGNNNNISQATTDFKPVYTQSAINSLAAIRYDGSNDFLEGNFIVTGEEITAFVVAKRLAVINTGSAAFTTYNSANARDSTSLDSFIEAWESTGNVLTTFRVTAKSSHPHPGNDIPYIFTTKFDGTNNIAYLNGTAATAVASAGNFNINTLLVGARFFDNSINRFYNGDIGEIIIYDRTLSTLERKEVESYLSKKWHII